MDADRLARELLRALRGSRSQEAFRRRLGMRSNVAYAWESGRRSPTAIHAHTVAQRMGVDVRAAWARFYGGQAPTWLADADPTTAAGLGRILEDLRGRRSLSALCRRAGLSRYAAMRWLRGETSPRLPDLLRYLEACTFRAADFVALWVDPLQLPSLRDRWTRTEAARQALGGEPWAQVVLLAVQLDGARLAPDETPAWIAARVGLDPARVRACLDLLVTSGQLVIERGAYRVVSMAPLEAPANVYGRGPKAYWAQQGHDRMLAGAEGLFSYAVFSVSEEDYGRAREVVAEAYRRLRAIVEASTPSERLVATNLQVFPLDR